MEFLSRLATIDYTRCPVFNKKFHEINKDTQNCGLRTEDKKKEIFKRAQMLGLADQDFNEAIIINMLKELKEATFK